VSEAVVELQEVSFRYNSVPVLEGINLQIEDGEFLGIVGPNAGGKSTLLRLILGLLRPTSGSVRVFGQSPRRASAHIGYVPQYPGFARDFPVTVEQVVLMGRLGRGFRPFGYRDRDWEIAIQAMEETETRTLAGRRLHTLSGGQLQRVLLARALACQPRMLLLDEPTSNIDMRLENEIFDLLKLLNERMTILVVSHDIAFISGYVRRVACVNRTLLCHRTQDIDGQIVHDLYGEDVRMVAHRH
jgi:zinc transport system ATP-binding protein